MGGFETRPLPQSCSPYYPQLFTKTTYAPDGSIVHIKQKYP